MNTHFLTAGRSPVCAKARFSRMASLAAIGAALSVSLAAQTAKFNAAEVVVRSINSDVYSIAAESNGIVFIACSTTNEVLKELPYNGGYVESKVGSGLNGPLAVAVDKNGAVYIADSGNMRVLKETPHNRGYIQTTLASGFDSPTGVAVDSAGNVYIADGPAGKIYKEKLVGTIYEASAIVSGLNYPYTLAVDANDDVFTAEPESNRVLRERPSGSSYVQSLVGSGLNGPSGVGVDQSGNVYIADYGNLRVLKETVSGSSYTQSTVRTASVLALPQTGAGPSDVAVDGAGNIYISDYTGGSFQSAVFEEFASGVNFGSVLVGSTTMTANIGFVFQTAGVLGPISVATQGAPTGDFAISGGEIEGSCGNGLVVSAGDTCFVPITFKPTLAGTRSGGVTLSNTAGNVIASGFAYGTGQAAQVNFLPGSQITVPYVTAGQASIYGVAVDGKGDVFVADANNNLVREEVLSGGHYIEHLVGSGLNSPTSLAIDGSGALYIADTQNNRVLKETPSPSGFVQTTIGSGMDEPYGVAVDENGSVYITDTEHKRVLKETLTAGSYVQSTLPASGLALAFGIAVDGSGNVYIADTGNKRVLKLTLANGVYSQSVIDSSLDLPYGIAVDGFGNLFIADFNLNAVFRESPTPSGYVGNPLYLPSTQNPYSVAVDGGGNLYIADIGTEEVYREDYADAPTLTFAPTSLGSTSADSPKTITLENIGNVTLDFPIPASGNNPSVSSKAFTLDDNGGSACTVLTPSSEGQFALAQNQGCLLEISFVPQAAGSVLATLGLKDSALNGAANSGQIIGLSGNGLLDTTVVEWATPQAIVYGTALSATQLNASAAFGAMTIPGTFVYTPPAGTVLNAGTNLLKAAFTPSNSALYGKSNGSVNLVVQKATLKVIATSLPKVYGAANPTLAYTYSGFVNGDTAATALTGSPNLSTTATTASGVGTYPITVAAGTLAAKNYTLQFVPGVLTVNKAPLTITANNASVVYNKPLPTFTYTPTGFVNGDTKAVLTGTPTEGTTAIVGSLPGAYPITIAAGTLTAANYSFVFKAGTLTVTPIGVAATPTFTPMAGTYSAAQSVTIKETTPGATIYYTVDGTTPTTASTKFTTAISVAASKTIKAIAVATGYTQSATASAVYTIH